jgi:hypothetical protein
MFTDIDQVADAIKSLFDRAYYAIRFDGNVDTINVMIEISDEQVIIALKMMRT